MEQSLGYLIRQLKEVKQTIPLTHNESERTGEEDRPHTLINTR